MEQLQNINVDDVLTVFIVKGVADMFFPSNASVTTKRLIVVVLAVVLSTAKSVSTSGVNASSVFNGVTMGLMSAFTAMKVHEFQKEKVIVSEERG